MGVTLEQLLTLAGRLDDSAGFDAPRERFRRFLGEYVNDAATSRALIEEAQNTPGEQHQRALQDLVVNLGRVLQFEVVFGSPNTTTGVAPYQGLWLSARSVVVLDVRSSRSATGIVDGLVRAVTTAKETVPAGTSVVGVAALVPLALSRRKIDDAITAASAAVPLHAMPLASLLSLTDLIAGEYLAHADVVRLLTGSAPVDFVVGLIEGAVEKATPAPAPVPVAHEAMATPAPVGAPGTVARAPLEMPSARREPKAWLVSVAPEHATPPHEFLETVVLGRQMFGISLNGAPEGHVRIGDPLCFYLDFKGVVGSARVDGVLEGGGGLREARRFRQVLHVDRVELHLDTPVPIDAETQVRLHAIPQVLGRRGQTLLELPAEVLTHVTQERTTKAVREITPLAAVPSTDSDNDEQLTG